MILMSSPIRSEQGDDLLPFVMRFIALKLYDFALFDDSVWRSMTIVN